jgi:hypothetical protein
VRDPDEAAYESWENLRQALARARELHGISKGDAVKLEDVVPNRSLLFRAACREQKPPEDTGLETDE